MTPAIVFIAITASWCPPCQQLHRDWDGQMQFIDVAQQPGVRERYGVRSLPTVIAMRDGQEIGRRVGYQGRREMERWMQSMKDRESTAIRRHF